MQKNHDLALEHFKKKDKKIYEIMKTVDFDDWFNLDKITDNKTLKLSKKDFYFITLCRNIVGQQLSGKVARSIFLKFETLLKNQINPKKIIETEENTLREAGLSFTKIKYVKDLSHKVINNELDLEKLDTLEDEEVINRLILVKGIGRWTAEMFLIFTLGRLNVFSYGDYGLKKGFSKIYGIENPSVTDIKTVIDKWEPYKTYGTICLWQSLEK